MYNIELECPICFDIINNNNNNIFFLNCCNKYAHISCLKSWYNNKNSYNCFLCTQPNNNITNLLSNDLIFINRNEYLFFKIFNTIIIIMIFSSLCYLIYIFNFL